MNDGHPVNGDKVRIWYARLLSGPALSRRWAGAERALPARVDVDLGSRAGVELPGERLRRAVKADQDRGERARVHPAVRVVLDGGRQARGRAEDANRRDVVQHDLPAVDQARPS